MYKFSISQPSYSRVLLYFFKAILLINGFSSPLHAQEGKLKTMPQGEENPNDTLRPTGPNLTDTTLIKIIDTTAVQPADTSANEVIVPTSSPLDTRVDYEAEDSMRFDTEAKKIYLYGKAKVVYGKITLTAGYIELDMSNKLLFATGITDSLGQETESPLFSEDGQDFTAKTMLYNFDTRKGLITEVITNEGEGYLHGGRVKKFEDDHLFIENGKYTTCNDPEPHFYISARKLKVIPNDKIITGPAYLMVEEVPTPLAVPFGYFPNKQGRSSGVLPPEYGESPQFGFYLTNGGYYFTISPYVDLSVRGDIYSGGSWGTKVSSNYKKRYRYNGLMDLRYSRNITGYKEFETQNATNQFRINWRHNLDPKARPGVSFTADVNGGSSNYNRFNTGTTTDFLNSSMQSNISWSKAFAGTPFMLALNGSHYQNTQDSSVSLNIPSATFTMSRIYPFRDLAPPGKLKWLAKTGINYSGNLSNSINTHDTALFHRESLNRVQSTFTNAFQASTAVNLRSFQFNPSVDFYSGWVLKSMEQFYSHQEGNILYDTIPGFATSNILTINAPLSTRIYGMYQFKPESKIQAIRHIIAPTIGFRYVPLLSDPSYYVDYNGILQPYSTFQNTGVTPQPVIDQGLLTFSLNNSLEMKTRSSKDTLTGMKKFGIIDNVSASTSYNLFADEFQLAPVVISGQTNLMNRININAGATFDPYQMDTAGRRINEFQVNQDGNIARLSNANLAIGFSFSSKKGTRQQQPPAKATQDEMEMVNTIPGNYVDFDIPWSFRVSYNLNYQRGIINKTVQGLQFDGDLNLTPKWKIGVRSGYDFVSSAMTHTSVNIYRDLHCWEMRFDWIPFGTYRGYSIQINVRSSMLQDLKLSRKRYWNDYRTFNPQ